jgi:1,2-diacylglycerol 3-alpha-glucosyltransferase
MCEKNNRLKIGFVTTWFERGQSYVTKTFRDVLADKYETFIFARMGEIGTSYGIFKYQETKGFWAVKHLTTYHDYHIPHDVILKWLNDNEIDIVFFNEEYDWHLVDFCKKLGKKVVTYLDFYKHDWKSKLSIYDVVFCSTKRIFNLIKDMVNVYYVGWGINTDLFKPTEAENKYTFFHNAGWFGGNYRKNTPAVIYAFNEISKDKDYTLLIHTQLGIKFLPAEIANIIINNRNITFHVETIPAPGLYHRGNIYIYPSKLDGLGLSLIEALSCGLPAITTDEPPMNEFVKDNYNGLLARVAERNIRQDNIAFPEAIIDIDDLMRKMEYLADNEDTRKEFGKNARRNIIDNNSLQIFQRKVSQVICNIIK